MPDLLIELFSEEIPARMQAQAARDLARLAAERLSAAGLSWEGQDAFCGPRRLTLHVRGLPAATPDLTESLKGPKASAPPQAVEGFLRKTGLTREQLDERDGVLYATVRRSGRPTPAIVAEMLDSVIRSFPWPKSMRSGASTFRWVRPLRRIVALFDGQVVPFEIEGLWAGDLTEGHRFMGEAQGAFPVAGFEDYRARLAERFVLLETQARKARILERAQAVCAARGLELVPDAGLLDEVAGLAEWPTPVLGDMDPSFLDLPPEVIRTSMRTHQKYFAVRRQGETDLAPHFVVVANVEAADGGAEIARGNGRVLSARLSDARYFWDEDRKAGAFERWLDRLKGVTFHARLGTMAERVARLAVLARALAPAVGADPGLAERAARLAKADLASAMVGEFPELQGVMGGYYARMAGEPDAVADAVRDHYRPLGPGDTVPTEPVAVAVALADKLDTLTGFFAIGETPTGSKDPYALRRAALGVIRLVRETGVRLPLRDAISAARQGFGGPAGGAGPSDAPDLEAELRAFFADRLKVMLRDEGRRHDLVDAVFALGDDDLVRIIARVEALDAFLRSEDGANLLAGYRRAANILKAEARKTPAEAPSYDAPVEDGGHGGAPHGGVGAVAPEEAALRQALAAAEPEIRQALEMERLDQALQALAALRPAVDAFFDKVLVNDPDPAVRLNRLRLLSSLRRTASRIADLDRVEG